MDGNTMEAIWHTDTQSPVKYKKLVTQARAQFWGGPRVAKGRGHPAAGQIFLLTEWATLAVWRDDEFILQQQVGGDPPTDGCRLCPYGKTTNLIDCSPTLLTLNPNQFLFGQ